MPPLENMCTARRARTDPTKPQKYEDNNMPPLEYAGSFLPEKNFGNYARIIWR